MELTIQQALERGIAVKEGNLEEADQVAVYGHPEITTSASRCEP